MFGFLFDWQ
jgi:hypothetical protein